MQMKKLILFSLLVSMNTNLFAQDEEDDDDKGGWFKKENLFTGGTVNVGFGNQITTLGIAPYFGYSINRFVDVAMNLQFNYVSQRDYTVFGDKVRQKVFGPGAFVRLFPVQPVFLQAQYEFNLIRIKYIPAANGGGIQYNEKFKFDAHSLLVGIGYAGGRNFPEEKSFYYFSIMWDVGKSENSPYKDNLNRAVPIIRAGYNIALFQGRRRGYR
jgi:hypothetical protein